MSEVLIYNLESRKDAKLKMLCRKMNLSARTVEKAEGDYTVIMGLDDEIGNLMTLELSAPNRTQARALTKAFQDRAEIIYQMIMTELIDEPEHSDVTF